MVKIVPNKFYVVDTFTGPIAGPFDAPDQAEQDRIGLNIADDCVVAETYTSSPGKCKFRPVAEQPAAA